MKKILLTLAALSMGVLFSCGQGTGERNGRSQDSYIRIPDMRIASTVSLTYQILEVHKFDDVDNHVVVNRDTLASERQILITKESIFAQTPYGPRGETSEYTIESRNFDPNVKERFMYVTIPKAAPQARVMFILERENSIPVLSVWYSQAGDHTWLQLKSIQKHDGEEQRDKIPVRKTNVEVTEIK